MGTHLTNMQRILIMGLPGSGKTTLATHLVQQLGINGKTVNWLNADAVRAMYNDWDFSEGGRLRQSLRMKELSTQYVCDFCIADFVAPLEQSRINFNPRWVVWVDTIQVSRYEDDNQLFVAPKQYDFRVLTQNAEAHAGVICNSILKNVRDVPIILSFA